MKENKIYNLAIMGGTFDPIHYGHIGCANAACLAFDIDKVLFVPAKNPNFKQNQKICDINHRLEMCNLALQENNNEKYEISKIEAERNGITYTSDTIKDIKEQYQNSNLFLIMGSDAVFTLQDWHNYKYIMENTTIIAVSRKGNNKPNKKQEEFLNQHNSTIKLIEADVVDISSYEIRQKIKKNLDVSSFLPRNVYNYILKNCLY